MTKVFITGGTGTLGEALIRTAPEDWEITVYSRDYLRQLAQKKQHPQVKFILGDVCDYDALYQAIVGHDIVIHAAANKHIPSCESDVMAAVRVNVHGSQNVAMASIMAGVKQLVGISTDKVVKPSSIYGVTKMIMERLFVQYAEQQNLTQITLCRYGNVLGSNGSVLQVWARQAAENRALTITDPAMSRFWLSEQDAVDIVSMSLRMPTGSIVIPKAGSMLMEGLAEAFFPGHEITIIGMRPGEKIDEELLTAEEATRCAELGRYLILLPDWEKDDAEPNVANDGHFAFGYKSSYPVRWIDTDEIRGMVKS